MKSSRLLQLVMLLALLPISFCSPQSYAQGLSTSGPGSALSIPHDKLMQPDELNLLLKGEKTNKPLVLQVGSHLLFDEAHIAGSVYAGPGSQAAGLESLKSAVAAQRKDKAIVLYCGCCPWNRCPNIGPAFKQLTDMGFTNVKALYLAENLGTDWVAKGYPVERAR